MTMPKIGFAGMTHLGIVSSTVISEKGFSTVCFDNDRDLVTALSSAELNINEPGLDVLIKKNNSRQVFTNNIEDLKICDIVYISIDVPTDDHGMSDLSFVKELIKNVISVLSDTANLVILCQVPPGFTRAIEGIDKDRLFYQVETLVFGRAVERAAEPERYIIGCLNPEVSLPKKLCKLLESFNCPIIPMRYESAELAKISINMCLVSSISVANTISELCESVGADWSEIVPALKLDKRIGMYSYLAPGLGIAGGNLERDLATVIQLSNEHTTDSGVVKAWVTNSAHRKSWAADILIGKILPLLNDPTIAIWGLSYKENTHSIKNSPSIATIKKLPETIKLNVHDPVVPGNIINRKLVKSFDLALDAASKADVLAILTPWPAYKKIDPSRLIEMMRGRIIIDPYRVFDAKLCRDLKFNYYTLGMPPIMHRGLS